MSVDGATGDLKSRVLSGLFWKFSERLGVQGIQFLVQVLLARLLFPKDYALVALVSVVIYISDALMWSGFNIALVQQKEVDDEDYSSVFYLGLGASLALYLLLFATAPWMAEFFSEPLLVPLMRVQSLVLILGAFRSIQNAILIRTMQFRKNFLVSFGGVVASGVVGLLMAFGGFGVWSLVFSQLANGLTAAVIIWLTVAWRPTLVFSVARVGRLFSFGWKILCAVLLDTAYKNLWTLVIGRLFGKDLLGYYNRGDSLAYLTATSIDGTIASVLLPALSSCQEDTVRLKGMLRRSIVTSCFLVFPAMFGLAAVAEPLIVLLLTQKWLGAVPFLQLCCLAYAFYPLHVANTQAINAVGRSDIFLILELIKKVLGITILVLSIPFGAYWVVGSNILMSLLCVTINAWPNKKLLAYAPAEQWKDIAPSLGLALFMGGAVWSLTLTNWSHELTLAVQILVGMAFYVGGAWLLKFECLEYLARSLREWVAR
ncbi:MAG: lipopolysaccharide biosynthesis protein [Candidatus Xenobium sp.]|jgi:teichuronic acid exporter|nr:lipopolysaccharide biosynthesis protein [Burkholderiales bacterium]